MDSSVVRKRSLHILLHSLIGVIGLSGCANLELSNLLMVNKGPSLADAEEYRTAYLTEGDPEALQKLFHNHIQNGMTQADVNAVIGEEGERVYEDEDILRSGGLYRTDDEVYRWGPDREGQVYMLVFRDGQLVNYEHFSKDL